MFRTATSGLTVLVAMSALILMPQRGAIAQTIQSTSSSSASITPGPEQTVTNQKASTSTTVGNRTTGESISVTETLNTQGQSLGTAIVKDNAPVPTPSITIGSPGGSIGNFTNVGTTNFDNFGKLMPQTTTTLPSFTISNPLPMVTSK